MKGIFENITFSVPIAKRVTPILDQMTMERLWNCSVRVSEMDLGPVISDESVKQLVASLDGIIADATNPELDVDDDVRLFVVRQCSMIRGALQMYDAIGNRGLRLATEASIGRWFTSSEITAKVPSNMAQNFRKVITPILNTVLVQTAVKQLQEAVDGIIKAGQ